MPDEVRGPKIRAATSGDMEQIVKLVLRLKRLNEEFDPLLKVSDDAASDAEKSCREAVETRKEGYVVLVAEEKGKIIGVIMAEIRRRPFYEPRVSGVITDFYVMPEYRRKKIGETLVKRATEELKKKGAGVIMAEFPFQNKIASSFYQKLGFRPVVGVFGKE
ncbi:MAG: GNAT family N-acetyltransferase [Thermoprotei archaeon]